MADNNPPSIDMAEQADQLRYLYNVYAQKYEALLNEISLYVSAQNILLRNVDLMEHMSKIENSNGMLALEGGVYIDAKIGSVKKVLTYVGAGYIVEKSVADAKEYFRKNEADERTMLQKLNEEKLKTEKDLLEISYNLQTLGR